MLYENLNNDQFNKEQVIQYYGSINTCSIQWRPCPWPQLYTNFGVMHIPLCGGQVREGKWEFSQGPQDSNEMPSAWVVIVNQ